MEIPEDLMTIARGCCTDNDIARAILAERKRCAEVARGLNGWGPVGGNKVADHIAKIIEAGR